MTRHLLSSVLASTFVVASITAPVGAGIASAHPSVTPSCRTQTFTWNKSKAVQLSAKKGPKTRGKVQGQTYLKDGPSSAHYQVLMGAKFVGVDVFADQPGPSSRIVSAVITPTKGKAKHYKVHVNGTTIYANDLRLYADQVQLPVNGTNGDGLSFPKVKKVVVTVREYCYPSDE